MKVHKDKFIYYGRNGIKKKATSYKQNEEYLQVVLLDYCYISLNHTANYRYIII